MSEFAKGCLALLVGNTVLVSLAVWVFDTDAGRTVAVMTASCFTALVAVRLWLIRPCRGDRR